MINGRDAALVTQVAHALFLLAVLLAAPLVLADAGRIAGLSRG
jgi:hypothetical protein